MKSLLILASLMSALTVREALAEQPPEFVQCLAGIKQRAEQAGISPQRLAALDDVTPVEKVIALDRSQPEFSQTFADYFNNRVTERRISEGKKFLKVHSKLLRRLQETYGIPPQYLLAFWGLETNFGSYMGKMPVLDSLATLACDARRSDYFSQELLQLLRLADKFDLPLKEMVGSWAGAMGHTQFMPTTYVEYATDGDGDGKVDLWHSTEDALSSAANFLMKLGWRRDERWGREVKLPKDFDFGHLGSDQKQSLAQWQQQGIRLTNGKPLPTADMVAGLYLPAGHTGPAFLGYHNFEVIQRWNRSEFYALAVGRLADRIMGAAPLSVSPPLQPRRSRELIQSMQTRLLGLGYDIGEADGVLGSRTSAAIRDFQRRNRLIADGFVDDKTLKALGVDSQAAVAQ